MRLDVFLHKVCLMKSRTMAGEACRRGKILVNGEPARASQSVIAGAILNLNLASGVLEVQVVNVPSGNVARKDAAGFYRILKDERGTPPMLF